MSFLKAISPLGGMVGMGASGLIPAKAIGALGGMGGAAATGLISPKALAPMIGMLGQEEDPINNYLQTLLRQFPGARMS